jgi:transposase-like protein
MPKRRSAASYVRRRRWTLADARAAVAALTGSGLSLSAFAEREGLEVERLRRWRRRLAEEGPRRESSTGAEVIELRPRRAETVEIVLASGRILRVCETIDVDALARLVVAVERAGC